MNADDMLLVAIDAALQAGKAIMQVYDSDFEVEKKEDKSPLTKADKEAHKIISKVLSETKLPLLSEEGKEIPYDERKRWKQYWLVDPLDGTKEFVKRNGEFTVNIALIENNFAMAGVIYHPVNDVLYFGNADYGSCKIENASKLIKEEKISLGEMMKHVVELPAQELPVEFTIVASRSHLSSETAAFIEEQKKKYPAVDFISAGSSLKLCMVAEGKAHVYPRFAPTMEWDIAAGHAIVKGAGKNVYAHTTGKEMLYNKPQLLNDWFIVR